MIEELKPKQHQIEGAQFLRINAKPGAVCGDKVGVGKTLEAILACEGDQRIIVITKSTLRDAVWKAEIEKWNAGTVKVIYTSKDVESIKNSDRWLIFNYESTRVDTRDKIVDPTNPGYQIKNPDKGKPITAIGQTLFRIPYDRLVLDEVHTLANDKAAWTQGTFKLADRAKNGVYMLSGTLYNKLVGLWPILRLARPTQYKSKWKFLKEHANAHPGVFGWEYQDYPTNPQALADEIKSFTIIRELEREYGMPTQHDVWLDMTTEQARLYEELLEHCVSMVDDERMVIASGLAQITRIRQLSISPKLLGSSDLGLKLPTALDFIDGADKTVVFCTMAEPLYLLSEMLTKEGLTHCIITGDEKRTGKIQNRHEVVSLFQNTKDVRAILLTPVEGITLTAAAQVVMIDRHWNPDVNTQCIGRVDRMTQTRAVTVHNLMTRGSADSIIYDSNKEGVEGKDIDTTISDMAGSKEFNTNAVINLIKQIIATRDN